MKAKIIVHSVCGNSYLVARHFKEALDALSVEAGLFRVPDDIWVEKPDVPPQARDILLAFRNLPEASPGLLEDADIILMGCPTYFGNVSGPMKGFMDSTGGQWFQGRLVRKTFAAFTSAGNPNGGGDLCLQAFHTYAFYMGMTAVPMPVTVLPGASVNALGVIHYSDGKYALSLDAKLKEQIIRFCGYICGKGNSGA